MKRRESRIKAVVVRYEYHELMLVQVGSSHSKSFCDVAGIAMSQPLEVGDAKSTYGLGAWLPEAFAQ